MANDVLSLTTLKIENTVSESCESHSSFLFRSKYQTLSVGKSSLEVNIFGGARVSQVAN